MNNAPNAVAIIMRAKNEMPHVAHALDKLRKQRYQNFSLYAIDSGSTDGTCEALRKQAQVMVQITPQEYIPGPVLNRMFQMTTEPIIVFLNADAIPQSDDWLEKMIQPLIDKKADCAFCRQIARPDARFIVRYDYERMYNEKTISCAPFFFSNVASAFTKEVLAAIPFPQSGFSEDIAWWKEASQRGYKRIYLHDIAVEHSHNYSLREIFRRGFIEGEAEARIFKKNFPFVRNLFRLIKEITRDCLYTCCKGRVHLVPYTMLYRISFSLGLYLGEM
jgi:rhamnosyltransferase